MERPSEFDDLTRLMEDEDIRGQLQRIDDEEKIVEFVLSAGEERRLRFDPEWLRQLFIDVRAIRTPAALTPQELEVFSKGGWAASSENKLCHTDSCGGRHGGCC